MLKTKTKIIIFIFLALGVSGVAYYNYNTPAVAQEPAAQAQAMSVTVIKTERKSVQIWKDYSARLEAVQVAEIKPQVSGVITEVKFEDGQEVESGDVLYVIDPRPYQAAVDQAKAELNAARNQYNLSKKEVTRARELIKSDAISKRILDERESAAKIANANVQTAQARLDSAKINVDYAFVKSPITGRAGRVETKIGNLVGAGPNAPMMTSVVANKEIFADFEVDEQTYINYIRSNAKDREAEQEIPVKLFLNNDAVEYEGFVQSFDNQINTQSGTIRARALFKNDDGALLPGMFARVKIGSSGTQKDIIIPEKAISTDQDRKFVYVVDKESKVAYRAVTLGENIKDNRVITKGLEEGEQVITEGIIRLRPGMPVSPNVQLSEAK